MAGKLHPSKEGECLFKYRLPPLPQSMYWITEPNLCGGYITRGKELKDHCVYYMLHD